MGKEPELVLTSNTRGFTISTEKIPIRLNENRCIRCLTCHRLCPFEAILVKKGKVSLNIEKCQLCGICASVCPIYNIDIDYYNTEFLIERVRSQKESLGTDNLVVMCRASSPTSCDILEVLKEQEVNKFVPLRLPCVGRVSLEFFLKAQLIGMKKIILVQCDDNSCRCKKGSENSTNNLVRFKGLLKRAGYEGDVLTLIKNPSKAVYYTEKCVGCDKCEFICPYDAIQARPFATPVINIEKCKGCGACALVCPHLAIQLQGFEYEPLFLAIQRYKAEAESKVKGASPLVLVFCCQWAEFSALDRVKDGFLTDNAVIVEVPCFNGLDPVQVIEAFRSGFSGVLAVVCSDDDCKLEEGRQAAKQNASVLLKSLESLNLADRFEICTTSPRYMGEFDSKLESFIEKISSLPKMTPSGD